jgi:uncharacterized protein (DUF2267 family)
MSTTGLAVFDTTVNETNIWLEAVQAEVCCGRHEAYVAMRAVLHALRDRLSPGGAMRLAAQMPLLLKGVFVEGWRPDETPVRTHTAEAFVKQVADRLPPACEFDPSYVTRAVITVLWKEMQGGAIAKAKRQVPADIRELWPDYLLVA